MADQIVKLVVSKVWHDTDQKGTEWVYVKGRNTADDSGFQQRTFAQWKGKATKNAETLDSLSSGDYVELGITEKGTFKNLTSVARIQGEAPPANTNTDYQAKGSGSSYSGGMSSNRGAEIARSVALKAAVDFVGGADSADVETVIAHARAFEAYLTGTDQIEDNVTQADLDKPGEPTAANDIPF